MIIKVNSYDLSTEINQLKISRKICKRCKMKCNDDNGYPVCNLCLQIMDNWES